MSINPNPLTPEAPIPDIMMNDPLMFSDFDSSLRGSEFRPVQPRRCRWGGHGRAGRAGLVQH